jgi:hypothetical protein
VNLAVEPSFTLSGLRSTAKIHDAENNHVVMFIITHLESFAWYRLYPPFRSMRQRAIGVRKSMFQIDRPCAAPGLAGLPLLVSRPEGIRLTHPASRFAISDANENAD